MGQSGRTRHRDREPGHRDLDREEAPPADRVFRMSDDDRQRIAQSLRYIDAARLALQAQHNAANREIIRELHASADAIFAVIDHLEEIDR